MRIKHNPNKDPKFHHPEIFEGAGESIIELFIIYYQQWMFRFFKLYYMEIRFWNLIQ